MFLKLRLNVFKASNTQTNRQTDKQTNRQTDKQTQYSTYGLPTTDTVAATQPQYPVPGYPGYWFDSVTRNRGIRARA